MTDITISHYRIIQEIGRGGMGRVFKAHDVRSGQMVAVKVIAEKHLEDFEVVKRFEREGLAASSLNHPHICKFYEVGAWNGRPFIVMELLQGETVRDRINRREPFERRELTAIAIQVTSALGAAHAKDILHRDLKPANVFLDMCGNSKLLDFGLAKFIRRKAAPVTTGTMATVAMSFATIPGTILGTFAYMAPEQARGEPVDKRTDLYSLGVVLHEMATGELPLAGVTSYHLPSWLSPIVQKLIAVSASNRYQSASELQAHLEALRLHEQVPFS